jgi:hypothetical protein
MCEMLSAADVKLHAADAESKADSKPARAKGRVGGQKSLG